MDSLTLDEIAKELNMSKTNLKRALQIERNLTDSMKELLDSGEISKTLAADTIASMSEEEQRSCYNVTKKGCEFIAHKLTGVKGTEFSHE